MNLLSKMFAELALESPDEAALSWACRTVLPKRHWTESSTLPVDETVLLRARRTQLPAQGEAETSTLLSKFIDDEESVLEVLLPVSSSEEDYWLVSDSEGSSNESNVSSPSSSPQARSTIPDTEVSSLSSSLVLEATKSEPTESEDMADYCEDLQALFHEDEVTEESSVYCLGRLFGNEDAAGPAEGLQAESADNIDHTPGLTQSESATDDDVADDGEGLKVLLSEDESTDSSSDHVLGRLTDEVDVGETAEGLQTTLADVIDRTMTHVDDSTQGMTSQDTSDGCELSSHLSSSQTTSTTPNTAMSILSAPQLFGNDKSESTGGKDMAGAKEGPTASHSDDESMGDGTEDDRDNLFDDEHMADPSEHAQSSSGNDTLMATPHGDGSISTSASEESSPGSATEEAPTTDAIRDASQPSTLPSESSVVETIDEMSGVEPTASSSTSSTSSSPFAYLFHCHNSPQELAIAGCHTISTLNEKHPIFKKLSDLGPDFLTHLQDEQKQVQSSVLKAVPDLHENVKGQIQNVTTPVYLVNLLKHDFNNGVVSLKQLRMLRHFVLQARSPPAVPPVRNLSNPFRDLLGVARPSHERHDPTLLNLDAIQIDLGNLELDLEAQGISHLLLKVYKQFINQPWLRNFRTMFEMPWDDAKSLTRISKLIIRHPGWGRGSYESALTKIDVLSPGKVSEMAFLIWICCKSLHRLDLKLQGNHRTYQDERDRTLKELFDNIAACNFNIIINSRAAKCLSWDATKALAEKEEHVILKPGFVDKAKYKKHVTQRKVHWKEWKNLANHLEPESPNVLAEGVNSATSTASCKRGEQAESSRDPKRLEVAENNGPEDNRPIEGHDQQQDHRRRREGGEYPVPISCTMAKTNVRIDGSTALAPSSRRARVETDDS